MSIRIVTPGALSLVQDHGRFGYLQYGVTQSGAMDQIAFAAANHILNNPVGSAEIEMTLMGITAEFTENTTICLTGADMDPKLDGTMIPMYQPVSVRAGQTLSLGTAEKGVRAYLAVQGGLSVPVVMGSRSTNLKAKMGGFEGRALAAGDEIPIGTSDPVSSSLPFPMSEKELTKEPSFSTDVTVRAVLGPQDAMFTEAGLSAFSEGIYTVLPQSDRMGMRLSGPKIESREGYDIISDGILFGSVQVTNAGEPIVMMADHQTTGGYAKIATVCSFDLPKLAQLTPGGTVRFEVISPSRARELYLRPQERYRSENKVVLASPRSLSVDGVFDNNRIYRGGWSSRHRWY